MSAASYLSPEVLFATAALLATWLILRWWNQNRTLPPGPCGLPILGYYPFIENTTHLHFSGLAKKYGPVFSFRTVGGRLFVVLNSAKVIKEVMVNRADEFLGRIGDTNLVSWLSSGLGITQEEGEPWSEHRKFFLQTAKNFGFGKMELEERIHDEVRRMMADIRAEGSKEVNLPFHVAYAMNSIISYVLFNKKFEKDETFTKNITDMFQMIISFVGKRLFLTGFAFNFFATMYPSLRTARDSVRKFTDRIVAEQIRTYDADHPRGYVDAFIAQREELIKKGKRDGGTFTRDRLEATTLNLYFEGTESTSTTLVVLLVALSRYPDIQKKIQEELDNVVGLERLPSWLDRTKLPYLDATIQELYRTQAQFLVTTIYSNFNETTIAGYRIPKRSAIVANLWSIHMDPEIYPEPEKFDPKRFLNDEGKRIKREGPYLFGLGKRSCIGESLAQMEIFIIISAMMQNFTLQTGSEEGTVKAIPRK